LITREKLTEVLLAIKNLYIRPDDSVLVILTEGYENAPMIDILEGVHHNVVVIPNIESPSQEYPLNRALLNDKTVGWMITNLSASHSKPTREMIDSGMFIISNPNITADWLKILSPTSQEICVQNAKGILRRIGGDKGGQINISSAQDGTDLTLHVPSGNWQQEIGRRQGPGTNGLFGEVCTAPYNARGLYVLKKGDFLTNPINRLTDDVRITISNNRIVSIVGGEQAQMFQEMLQKSGNPLACNLGEFAFGINLGGFDAETSVVAEKLLGGVHIAAGTNSMCLQKSCPEILEFEHGRYNAGIHIDAIKFGASVSFKAEGESNWRAISVKGRLVA
jgi:hypothetical protein